MELNNNTIIILICVLIVTVIAVIWWMVSSSNKEKLTKEVNNLYVRFNEVKTIPLAFKFNKAQLLAKRNEEMSASVLEYFAKYEESEKHIKELQECIDTLDDALSAKNKKAIQESMKIVDEKLLECEKEVKEIDEFLDEFSKKEAEQREYSSKLKEEYRMIKETINTNSNILSIAYNGVLDKLKECEDLFSSSEEWIYASDYLQAQNELDQIEEKLAIIKTNANQIPKLIKDTKGVLPIMLEKAHREYLLTKQRFVNVEHLNADETLLGVENTLKEDLVKLSHAEVEGIKEHVADAKEKLNSLVEALAIENRSFDEAKDTNNKAYEHIKDLERVENYVRVAYDKESQRFGLEDLTPILKQQRSDIEKYKRQYKEVSEGLASALKSASLLLLDAEKLDELVETDLKIMYSYKTTIDKSTDGEVRAKNQLTKLQLVISEVEAKIEEYNLPSISSNYKEDLGKSREYIVQIRSALSQIPIDIDELNELLDEAIDFIYKFYNNVNNIVGMAIMVENAIVFGNKYRSSYPEIDAELSKAEFQYLNGEYTKALKTAIACMETLFPDNADQKILETIN